jgi:hypothetical protein
VSVFSGALRSSRVGRLVLVVRDDADVMGGGLVPMEVEAVEFVEFARVGLVVRDGAVGTGSGTSSLRAETVESVEFVRGGALNLLAYNVIILPKVRFSLVWANPLGVVKQSCTRLLSAH